MFLDINYFHCVKIVELLKISESATRNIFGRYSSKRMKVYFFIWFSAILICSVVGVSVVQLFKQTLFTSAIVGSAHDTTICEKRQSTATLYRKSWVFSMYSSLLPKGNDDRVGWD